MTLRGPWGFLSPEKLRQGTGSSGFRLPPRTQVHPFLNLYKGHGLTSDEEQGDGSCPGRLRAIEWVVDQRFSKDTYRHPSIWRLRTLIVVSAKIRKILISGSGEVRATLDLLSKRCMTKATTRKRIQQIMRRRRNATRGGALVVNSW